MVRPMVESEEQSARLRLSAARGAGGAQRRHRSPAAARAAPQRPRLRPARPPRGPWSRSIPKNALGQKHDGDQNRPEKLNAFPGWSELGAVAWSSAARRDRTGNRRDDERSGHSGRRREGEGAKLRTTSWSRLVERRPLIVVLGRQDQGERGERHQHDEIGAGAGRQGNPAPP